MPEDEIVPVSIAEHIPAVMLNKKSNFSRATIELANAYSAMSDVEPEVARPHSFWRALLNLFRRSK